MRISLISTVFAVAVVGCSPAFAGPLSGVNGHSASGSATIDAGKVELGSDFRFDGGPDVYVAVKNGDKIQLLGKLRANDGAQSYALPAGGDEADEILLYCKQYNVTLGKASAN